MKVEYNIPERLLLVNALPQNGSYEHLVISGDIRRKLGLSQDEIEKYEIKTSEEGLTSWNEAGAKFRKSAELTELEVGVIKKTLETLNDQQKLSSHLVPFYKTFVLKEKSDDETDGKRKKK